MLAAGYRNLLPCKEGQRKKNNHIETVVVTQRPFFIYMRVCLGYLISFALLIFSCEKKEDMSDMPLYEGPVMEIKDVVTLFSDSAKVRVRLEAPTQFEFENGDREFPDGVYIEFFEKDGTKSSTLRADRGEKNAKENLYKAEGNVVVISLLDGDELNTEELYWTPIKEEIFTDKFVTIRSEGEIHTGEGMTARQDFSSYSITKPTGTLTIDDPQ